MVMFYLLLFPQMRAATTIIAMKKMVLKYDEWWLESTRIKDYSSTK